jgi:predicted ATP-grasp superfamily ATP-dependent carboligase
LVIAPETDHVLLNIARQVQQAQKQWLGCDQPAITVCGDKLQCWHLLEQHNIQTPVTQSAEAWLLNPVTTSLQWVIKPVDGAGCEDTYLLGTRQTREQLAAFSLAERQQFIVQPYISGQTLSLSLFISDNDIDLLSINAQIMTQHQQQLKLTHCQVNLDHLLSPAVAIALAGRIHDTMPGLWGFVGIDLIKTADQLWVIDINPRLTSSYAEAEMRQYHNPALALHTYLTQP